MNVYLIRINGWYPVSGELLVIDGTKRKAFNQAKKKLEEIGLFDKNKNLKIDDVEEIQTDKRDSIVINDGNY